MAARILIVEDNPDLLAILREVLSVDYEVMTAERGEQAIGLARTFDPDLVLLDLLLPDMDGIQVGTSIKNESSRPIPVLVLTARADLIEPDVLNSGCCDAYMSKPAPLPMIRAKVDELLTRELHFSPS